MSAVKAEIGKRWPMTELVDVLKETAPDTGCLDAFETSASRVALTRHALDRRLLLSLYSLGTNAGLKRIAAASSGVSYEELLHVRRRFIHPDALREACARVAKATLSIRNVAVWGDAGTTCASDSRNRIEDQEISMLALHLLQASLIYVNTRMMQTVLVEPDWSRRMTPEDYRGLTPLTYAFFNPYGRFELDMGRRIDFERRAASFVTSDVTKW